MRTILILFLSCLVFPLLGQQYNGDCNSDKDYAAFLQIGLQGFEYGNPVENYEGNQYFNKWTRGEVILINGDAITDIYLRYEKYLDALLWLRESDYKQGIIQKQGITGFSLFNAAGEITATFVKKRYKQPYEADSTDAFFHILVSGELTFYAYRRVIESPNDYLLIEDTRYLLGNKEGTIPLVLKRKALLEHPLVDKTKMKGVLRSGGIMVSNGELEMIRAIMMYNSNQ